MKIMKYDLEAGLRLDRQHSGLGEKLCFTVSRH